MSNKHGAIGVRGVDDGRITVCASADPGANYHTLCGNSLDDDMMEEVPIASNARITCCACRRVWEEAKRFKSSDFAKASNT